MKHAPAILAFVAPLIAWCAVAQAPLVPILTAPDPAVSAELEHFAQQATPEPYIQELYRELQLQPTPGAFSGGPGASHIYAKPLLSSVHKAFWTSSHSFGGVLDFSPLCTCKNPAGFALSPLQLSAIDKNHTDAAFLLRSVSAARDSGAADAHPFPEADAQTAPAPALPDRRMVLHLVRGEHGWRIDDISSAEVRSLKIMLQNRTPPESGPNAKP